MGSARSIETLRSGLWLEDSNTLLPWGARYVHLQKWANPERIEKRVAWSELYWAHPSLLGGISAQFLQVILFPYGWFDSATIYLEKSRTMLEPEKRFDQAFRHVSALFGEPVSELTSSAPGDCACSGVARMARWEYEAISLSLICHEAGPYEDIGCAALLHIASRNCCGVPSSLADKRAGWVE